MIKVFIDGSQGTTGLRLKDRLMERKDIELLTISEEERKSLPARAQKSLRRMSPFFVFLTRQAANW